MLVVGVTAGSGVGPVWSQDPVDEARDRKREISVEEAEIAADLDVLAAEDAAVVAALEDLDAGIAVAEARLQGHESDLDGALERADGAVRAQAELGAEIADLRALVVERVVELYMSGPRGGVNDVLALSSEPIDAALAQWLVEDLNLDAFDVVDQLRVAEDNRGTAADEAEAAAADAAAAAALVEEELVGLTELREAREEVRAEIARRVGELEAEAEELRQADRDLEEFINAELARREAERLEAERREAERLEAERREAERLEAEREEAERSEEERDAGADADEPEERAEDGDESPADSGGDDADEQPPTPEPEARVGMTWPLSGTVTSGFGNRVHPIYGTVRFHAGLDISAPQGTPVGAALAGSVLSVGSQGGYGQTVIVDHGGGVTTVYPHLSGYNTSVGAQVAQGEVIGYVGSTGLSTGPHLHFEVRIGGAAQDPMLYLP